MSSLTIKAALQMAVSALSPRAESAHLDAELLLAQVLNKPRSYLFTWPEKVLSPEQAQHFQALLQQRLQGHPIAHLIGQREFWTLDLMVTPDTLIPRPETELLVELALERLPHDHVCKVLDLGTGTGAITLALASERPLTQITAIERSAPALEVAKRNAERHQLTNIQFLQSSWFAELAQNSANRFDMIVSNPPYIAAHDEHLSQGDVRFEPLTALAAGQDGLDDLKIIIQQAPAYLSTQGWLLVEHGYDQGVAVRALYTQAGFQMINTHTDLAGHDRVTLGHVR
ncbi:peptide chain release factor N(5)-glutamine methyltransferase [Thiofilum flexile]|uniref:peptide chain release factor N(5)-glutamine methyltransferase n=1 Tax=Thiofilum flexile TaxID=125627 RepID=UPI0003781CFC|nr:peptide chain release factor N(5)-glutamine methyltransferase [Thiofilum flexile]